MIDEEIRKQKKRESRKKYKINNPEKVRESQKSYYKNNREKLIKQSKEYKYNNKQTCNTRDREYSKHYRQKNTDKIKQKDKEYRTRYDIKIVRNLRKRMRRFIFGANKSLKSMDLLGCTREFFLVYLESMFEPDMNWENYGFYGWHIDHIIPCSSFDLFDIEQQKKCFHYTNLRPLWAKDNLSKGSKIIF